MRSLLMMSLISIFTVVTQAETSIPVMMDGSVAACHSSENVGNRAYRMTLITEVEGLPMLTIESLICKNIDNQFAWKWMDIGEELPYNFNGKIVKKKIIDSKLQITDFEGTQVLELIPLETNLAVQTVILSDKVMNQKTVSLVLQNVTEITLKGEVIDTDYSSTGIFVLKIK